MYANDYVCQGEVYSQPASLPLYPKSPYSRRLFYKRNIIGNQVFTWAWRFKECLFDTELKAAQDYDIFLRMVVEYGEPWKVEEATQILHINHGEMQITSSPKNSPDTSTFTASTKTNSTVPVKNISCLPSTRSAINV